MPGYVPDARAIVNLIKRNLQDRYASGYPILKELLQNADDARARRFSLDALPGWPDAGNPLLQGPGLLVANDGEFSPDDRKGILAFGDSVKATDRAAVGRFGLGQKAVFHLCDAFVVHAFDEDWAEPFSSVVNPFLGVEVEGNVTETWEHLQDDDVERLRGSREVGRRALFLWLPFRRPGLRPAREIVGFSADEPRIDDTVRELARSDELQVLLSALRNLVSIEILEKGRTVCAVHTRRADRLLGPDAWHQGERSFGGRIGLQANGADARVAPFVGREATLPNDRLAALQKSDHWPQTITIQKTEREKGEPHGAAILLRGSGPGARRPSLPSRLTISWAVFLPIAEGDDGGGHQSGVEVLPIATEGTEARTGPVRLLLHGYFFLDGGRNRIEGLTAERADDPKDAAALRVAWNAALRDEVVLPLIPAVLKDARDKKVLHDADLGLVVQAIGGSRWFVRHRAAICERHVLVRAVQGKSIAWRLASAHDAIRPLPAAHADARARLDELFPEVAAWAEERELVLCVNQHAALVPATTSWTAEELGSLFSGLQPCAFQSPALTELLGGILAATTREDDQREAIGTHLARALREALIAPAALAPADSIANVLRHAPPNVFFPLPRQVEEREVLRALASVEASVLPVRGEWLPDVEPQPASASAEASVLPVRGEWLPDAEPQPASQSDLVAFLRSLEPLIASEKDAQADQAAAAAVALLRGHPIAKLANREDLASLKVLKARDPGAGSTVLLSLGELVERGGHGLLFKQSPGAEPGLRTLIAAVPDVTPVIVAGRTADVLGEQPDDSRLRLRTAEASAIEDIVKAAGRFGPDEARAALIEALDPNVGHDRDALRMLCTGVASVRYSPNALRCLDGDMTAVERLVTEIVHKDHGLLFVPSCISNNFAPKLRQHLAIQALDSQRLERLLDNNIEAMGQIGLTEAERSALLCIDGIDDEVLLRLPIHDRSDGTVGRADDAFRVDDWPIPEALAPYVSTVRLFEDQRAQDRQRSIIRRWDCRRQIETALTPSAPERFCESILDALASLSDGGESLPRETRSRLRETPWIAADRFPVAPKDVLSLPETVAVAALDLLSSDGEGPPFRTIAGLPVRIRKHSALRYLTANLFPDEKLSVDALAKLIDEAELIGLLGRREDYPLEHFATLAESGAELDLPAWPLLRSVLSSIHDVDNRGRIVSSLRQLSGEDSEAAGLAARHLDALAERAKRKDATASAARHAYRHGFEAVAGWPEDRQYEVFGATKVPTASGGWRSGREVAGVGHGIALTHLLASEYAGILERQDASREPLSSDGLTAVGDPADGLAAHGDADTRRDDSSEQLREFLGPWRSRVPSELVITFLGLLGRHAAMSRLAQEWETESKLAATSLWGDLDQHMTPSLKAGSPVDNPLEARVDELCFQVTEVAGKHVRASSLCGDEFDAPLGDESKLVVGNLHRESYRRRVVLRAKDGSRKLVIQLHLRPVAVPEGFEAARDMFRRLVETVATDCLRLHMSDQQAALGAFLDEVGGGDQPTLDETRRLLRDQLPTLLSMMKLPAGSRCQQALREYQRAQGRVGRVGDRPEAGGAPRTLDDEKDTLWQAIEEPDSAAELLSAVRDRIRSLGYSGDRVVFELFQNADDACAQQPDAIGDDCFEVEYMDSPAGFRVVHWGRPINHLGVDHDRARQLGHDLDLLNMLVMNLSEKRPEDRVTGKFGLGFKSVHILSDSVGIASRFIALRTRGGMLPQDWPGGIDLAAERSNDGRRATVVDIPYADEPTAQTGRAARTKFAAAAPWLPAFARRIRRIDITGGEPHGIRCEISGFPPELPGSGTLDVVKVTDMAAAVQRMLRFDLGRGFHLLISIGDDGPRCFPDDVGRLWNLAPLEENLRCGWLLNGPFRVDPGRGRLAGSDGDRCQPFERLGEALGERLLALHDLISRHWSVLVEALSLAPSTEPAQFWSRLFDVMCRDTACSLACHLHREGRGYARLLAERATAPTGLTQSFDGLVRAADVAHYATRALADSGVLHRVETWPSLSRSQGRIVAGDVAPHLRSLGFEGMRPLALCDLLREELGAENRVGVELAERLGRVITLKALEADPIRLEQDSLLTVLRQAKFRAKDRAWRSVRELSLAGADNEDERRIARFAPERALLDPAYTGAAVEFFLAARSRSGYGPRPELLVEWAEDAHDDDRRRAVLRYVIDGQQGRSFAKSLRTAAPAWLPKGDRLGDHDLLRDLPGEDRKRLIVEFDSDQLVASSPQPSPAPPPPAPRPGQVGQVIEGIHGWWRDHNVQERKRHEKDTYPSDFSFSALQQADPIDRTAWFTMFALACFQSLGRTQDEHNRSFVERGWKDGWWAELAESRPPESVEPWLNRLERWSRPEAIDQRALYWKRTFVDLYTVARWLPEYVLLLRKFPDIVRERDPAPVSLSDLLRPSYSSVLASLGTEAAPVNRTLGSGVNWMIRELTRKGLYGSSDADLNAPYCWTPTQRVRRLLLSLRAPIEETSEGPDESRAIYRFVAEHIGADRARFEGDFDLPLQVITRERHRHTRDRIFQAGGIDVSAIGWE